MSDVLGNMSIYHFITAEFRFVGDINLISESDHFNTNVNFKVGKVIFVMPILFYTPSERKAPGSCKQSWSSGTFVSV